MTNLKTMSAIGDKLLKVELPIVALVLVGVLFKIQHWPFAGMILVLSMSGLSMIYYFKAFGAVDGEPMDRFLNKILHIALSFIIVGLLFKIQHWPGAGIMQMVGTVVGAFGLLSLVSGRLKGKNQDPYTMKSVIRAGVIVFIGALYVAGLIGTKVILRAANHEVDKNLVLLDDDTYFFYHQNAKSTGSFERSSTEIRLNSLDSVMTILDFKEYVVHDGDTLHKD